MDGRELKTTERIIPRPTLLEPEELEASLVGSGSESSSDEPVAAERQLSALPALESLNLYGVDVTAGALEPLSSLPNLTHVYVGQTQIDQTAARRLPVRSTLQFEKDVRC